MDAGSGARRSSANGGSGVIQKKSSRTGLMIDPLGGGDIQIALCFPNAKAAVLTGIPKRQARAIANRILHEIEYAEGTRSRRPSSPHISYESRILSQFCKQCGNFPVRDELDGDRLCQLCSDKWVAGERPDPA